MSNLFNPFAFGVTGEAARGEFNVRPRMRTFGGQITEEQHAMARRVFADYCANTRLSFAPNPVKHGRLHDGTPYKCFTINGVHEMVLWADESAYSIPREEPEEPTECGPRPIYPSLPTPVNNGWDVRYYFRYESTEDITYPRVPGENSWTSAIYGQLKPVVIGQDSDGRDITKTVGHLFVSAYKTAEYAAIFDDPFARISLIKSSERYIVYTTTVIQSVTKREYENWNRTAPIGVDYIRETTYDDGRKVYRTGGVTNAEITYTGTSEEVDGSVVVNEVRTDWDLTGSGELEISLNAASNQREAEIIEENTRIFAEFNDALAVWLDCTGMTREQYMDIARAANDPGFTPEVIYV